MDSSKNPHKKMGISKIIHSIYFRMIIHISYYNILYICSLVIYLHVVAYMDHAPLTNWDAHHGVSDIVTHRDGTFQKRVDREIIPFLAELFWCLIYHNLSISIYIDP